MYQAYLFDLDGTLVDTAPDLNAALNYALQATGHRNVDEADSMQIRKPGAEPALYACNELDTAPSDTLFVGDSETDIGCARAAGCDVVCVKDGYNHGEKLENLGADAIIGSLMDLLREQRFS